MQKITLNVFFFLICLNVLGQRKKEVNAVPFLQNFYSSYIVACNSLEESNDLNSLKSLRKENCTYRLINKLQRKKLEFDPFFNSQDCPSETKSQLQIHPVKGKKSTYEIFFTNVDGSKTIIRLLVIQIGQKFKIDDILSSKF